MGSVTKNISVYPLKSSSCGLQTASGFFEEPRLFRQYPSHYTDQAILTPNVQQQIPFPTVGILLAERLGSRV